ncbi:hypothetical protein B0J13DRAFT_98735 [Dactylonectria estremocensis]|uniref:Carboxylesterase family protein n=1 Tax=Dactylonectria estremocensis TaxID=1079267 RepID=A0A9P9E9Y2_9HYPO|nr:hypothetical protein B0J13DRAFT_98735 [Dactylonectria estremocensis]
MVMARINRATDSSHTALTSMPSTLQHSADIDPDTNAKATTTAIASSNSRGFLQELPIGQVQNKSIVPLPTRSCQDSDPKFNHAGPNFYSNSTFQSLPEIKPTNTKPSSQGLQRRVGNDWTTSEPLDAVLEESSIAPSSSSTFVAAIASAPVTVSASASPSWPAVHHRSPQAANTTRSHPLMTADFECPRRQQIEKHMAGQFEWIVSCPAPASSAKDQHSQENDENRCTGGTTVFGCNLLSRKQRSVSHKASTGCLLANSYTLLATPLEGDAYMSPDSQLSHTLDNQVDMALDQPPAYTLHPSTPLKVPDVEIAEVAEQAVSPSLTLISDKSSSYAGGSSRTGSFSVPRIEDSLAELDKLEEELEAINAVAHTRRINPDDVKASSKHLEPRLESRKSTVSKRASMGSLSATVRIKQSERPQPSVRRSTSLVFRNKKEEQSELPRLKSQLSRSKLATAQLAPPKPPVKSTKAPTVPNFELPGEAVARRLREQREARLAQQAEAQKAYVAPPRPKSNKPLTKPNFELPGEAISRRKREEREARLKAQEEEQKKKREFKAKPMRSSIAPSTLPRETVTSRARQSKTSQDSSAKAKLEPAKSKRFSLSALRSGQGETADGKPTQNRGRLATMASNEDLSRGTSTSTGSSTGKRNTLSAEECQQLKLKGKQIFERDNTSFTQDKERERREREAAARLAREQAAERSRAASRDWAEKKRRKELAMRDAMRDRASQAV